ncbi:hypothetical protein [Flammeovirga kamogawensis]|uniref:Lipoprotein n=1 Tax=Flammeovirga kamogawensis TaxID=373891 RepID=A0ABX8GYT0_9BACT|nr:hypothetical protein [Flammeovirga kamogawensis]MBB6459208.1 hypothetical protein [Flammeovirga kamogawensis]QWG08773.1 hypothetical protein KM029_07480 [Flammeovirga kamogawensis]TRX67063.1 hypothetical protein EO216_02525 [Flammeovirga kamogawensis]
MKRILQFLLPFTLLFLIAIFINACQPIESYPLKTGYMEFNWDGCNTLTAKVTVLDRYPMEPPIYGATKLFTRASDTVMVSKIEFKYRGTCTIEPYKNPETFPYASVKQTFTVNSNSISHPQLWDTFDPNN